jgi:hypothetical protein
MSAVSLLTRIDQVTLDSRSFVMQATRGVANHESTTEDYSAKSSPNPNPCEELGESRPRWGLRRRGGLGVPRAALLGYRITPRARLRQTPRAAETTTPTGLNSTSRGEAIDFANRRARRCRLTPWLLTLVATIGDRMRRLVVVARC